MQGHSTGVFKGIFIVLSLAIGAFGAAVTIFSLTDGFSEWSAGPSVVTDGLILGALFLVMGVGFLAFGVMVGREGWDAPSDA